MGEVGLDGRSKVAIADQRRTLDEILLQLQSSPRVVSILESFYEVERRQVAELMRAAIAMPSIKTVDRSSLLRALEVYEVDRLDFAEAYLVAQAESTSVGMILTFDRSVERVSTVTRQEP